jgi:hypothetical protein
MPNTVFAEFFANLEKKTFFGKKLGTEGLRAVIGGTFYSTGTQLTQYYNFIIET